MKSTIKIISASIVCMLLVLQGCSEEKASEEGTTPEATEEPKAEEAAAEGEQQEKVEAAPEQAEADKAADEAAEKAAEPEKKTDPSDDVKANTDGAADGNKSDKELKLDAARDGAASRQKELQAVYALGRKGDDESIAGLVDIIKSDKEPGIRATAVRVLGRTKRADLVELLSEQAQADVLPVKIEAAILLFQWGEKKVAKPILEQLSTQGVALRRAFLTGRRDGKNQYDSAAKKFLSKGLKSDNVYTRLDAALGLYEINGNKQALKVFKSTMEEADTFYVRMAALNYLRHLKDDTAVRGIIEIGTKDKDDRVSQRANQILNEQKRGQNIKPKK